MFVERTFNSFDVKLKTSRFENLNQGLQNLVVFDLIVSDSFYNCLKIESPHFLGGEGGYVHFKVMRLVPGPEEGEGAVIYESMGAGSCVKLQPVIYSRTYQLAFFSG